jgi:hypothetical protein
MLQPQEHLYLFSIEAMKPFFKKVSSEPLHVTFEPAIFAHYDMYMVVSRENIVKNTPAQIDDFLGQSVKTRFVQSMLDLASERDRYINLYQQADADRIARLAMIKELEQSGGVAEYVPVI